MGSSGSNEEAQKEFKASLFDVGKKLVKPPSSIDELLIILEEADNLLPFVPQSPHRSMIVAILPAMQGLISNELLKHPDLDIQVAVASCTSEMARITAPDFPYRDDHMRILETVAGVKSCLIMLDIEIDPMVVEMFQLFLDTIKPNHSSDMFNHMKTIMILIIQKSDEISVELLRPLLSSVRMDNKNTSPRSWELGKSVFENCATKLQHYVREAVKAMNVNVDDYAEIVASLCQDTPIARDTVANEEVESVRVANEEVTTAQFEATDASGDGFSKLDERSQTVPETEIQVERRRRGLTPNTFMGSDEGYQHTWLAGGSGSSRAYYYLLSPSELENAETPRQKEIDSVKKASIGKRGQSKQSKVKKKHSNKQKKTTKSIAVRSNIIGAEKEKVSHSVADSLAEDENEITPQKHESANVVEKVMESPAKAESGDLDPEKEKEPMDFCLEYGRELVNLRIMVWWPLDQTYYTGTVESFDPVSKKHKIKYDDDEEEILDMSEEIWELFNEIQSREAQSSRQQEAGPSPDKEPGKIQKMTTKRKANSSKKHVGTMSKRSKREGHSIIKFGHSTLESIPVNDESDDETREANFSWKAKAMSRAGREGLKTSRRKGKPSRGAKSG